MPYGGLEHTPISKDGKCRKLFDGFACRNDSADADIDLYPYNESKNCFHKSTLIKVLGDNGESTLSSMSDASIGSRVLVPGGKYEALLVKLTHEDDETI